MATENYIIKYDVSASFTARQQSKFDFEFSQTIFVVLSDD